MKNLILVYLASAILTCNKSDTEPPLIEVSSPISGQVVAAGQLVTVSGTITDNEGIHTVHVQVTDNAGNHLVHKEDHWDGRTYTLHETFTPQTGKLYTLHIDAGDHDGNMANRDLTVSCN